MNPIPSTAIPTTEPTLDLSRWTQSPLAQLIDHIVGHYHERLRVEMPALIELAERVERVHAGKPECPRGLAAFLRTAWVAVQDHLAKEERVLFPIIRIGAGSRAGAPIHVMEIEHDEHRATLERIRALTTDLTPPAFACATWRALYARLAAFESELLEHIRLENTVLFPRALCG